MGHGPRAQLVPIPTQELAESLSSRSPCVAMPQPEHFDVPAAFRALLASDPDLSTGLGAIRVLMQVLERCQAATLQELVHKIKAAKEEMKTKVDCSSVSVVSGGELFLRFITLNSEALELEDNFEKATAIMLKRGEQFLNRLMEARPKIARLAEPFLKDGSRILVHSHSKCVLAALKEASEKGRRLQVYVTENSLDKSGVKMHESLQQLGIPSTLIMDAAVGYIMAGKVDCVLMGAEGVMESGGIVNKLGSYTLALCAKELNKPVYVLCESFKFIRYYPLGQDDLPVEFKYHASTLQKVQDKDDPKSAQLLSREHPLVDYTPPSFVTLLFTDLGVLTPSAVSDELIKLYL